MFSLWLTIDTTEIWFFLRRFVANTIISNLEYNLHRAVSKGEVDTRLLDKMLPLLLLMTDPQRRNWKTIWVCMTYTHFLCISVQSVCIQLIHPTKVLIPARGGPWKSLNIYYTMILPATGLHPDQGTSTSIFDAKSAQMDRTWIGTTRSLVWSHHQYICYLRCLITRSQEASEPQVPYQKKCQYSLAKPTFVSKIFPNKPKQEQYQVELDYNHPVKVASQLHSIK